MSSSPIKNLKEEDFKQALLQVIIAYMRSDGMQSKPLLHQGALVAELVSSAVSEVASNFEEDVRRHMMAILIEQLSIQM